MKYFQPHSYPCSLPGRPGLNNQIESVYLGKELTAEFSSFYSDHLGLVNHYQVQEVQCPWYRRFDVSFKPSFKTALNYFLRTQIKNKYANRAHDAGDRLFEAFTPVWGILLDNQRLFSASLYWRRVLEVVGKWERRNACEVHKGTPYSFWALSEILVGSYDAGFMLMHKALSEDARYYAASGSGRGLRTPAAEFVRLDIRNPGSFFRRVVIKMRRALSERIRTYNRDLQRNFSLRAFERKFFLSPDLEEVALFFNFSHLKVTRIIKLLKLGLGASNLSSHILLEGLLSFCKVAEAVVRETNAARNLSRGPSKFNLKDFLVEMAPLLRWSKDDMKKLIKDVDKGVRSSNQQDVERQFTGLLERKVVAWNGRQVSPEISDYLLLRIVRNIAAHSVGVIPSVLIGRYNEVSQAIYNGLFFAIENYQSI